MSTLRILLAAVAAAGLIWQSAETTDAASPSVHGLNAQNSTTASDKTALKADNGFRAPTWRRDTFEGSAVRTFSKDGQKLYVELDQDQGGFDTAINRGYPTTKLDQVSPDAKVHFNYEINLDIEQDRSWWWVGPKVDIRTPGTRGLTGNYENYIVENISMPIDEFHQTRLNRIEKGGGRYLGTLQHDGSTYRYYHIKHKNWGQYWAVREDYRSSGTVSLRPILDKWREGGMENRTMDSIRINIETSGVMSGSFVIKNPGFPKSLTNH